MKKTTYMIFVLAGIIAMSIIMTGCSDSTKAENADLNQEVSKVVQENQQLKEEISQLQQKNQELDEEIIKLDPTRSQENPDTQVIEEAIFNIYGANVDTYERELIDQVAIDNSEPLEKKLQVIGDNISKQQFEGLGIEVSKIEEEDGKKIGIINLVEKSNGQDTSWDTEYFQGSAGGIVTTISLEESFLQRDYEGEWIDGVRFLYNGEQLEFDHVESLGQTIYR